MILKLGLILLFFGIKQKPQMGKKRRKIMSKLKQNLKVLAEALKSLGQKSLQKLAHLVNQLRNKLQVKLDKNAKYEARWVWYHSLLAIELLVIILVLIWILWKI